jgi:hypothetical protein
MKLTLLAITLLSIKLLSTIKSSKSECCSTPIKCEVGSETTYRCYDCTPSTYYCGVGKCNIFGCNCDGGCRQGNSSLGCWNIASGCKLRLFYERQSAQNFFNTIDTDSDGRVSFDEAKYYINQNRPTGGEIDQELEALDTNNDGFLAFNEIDGY